MDGHAANILTYIGMYKWTIHTMSFGFFSFFFFCHYRPYTILAFLQESSIIKDFRLRCRMLMVKKSLDET